MARASALHPCSEHVSGWGPAMMSPAGGVGVETAGQVPEPSSWKDRMRGRPHPSCHPQRSPSDAAATCSSHPREIERVTVFQPPTLPRAPRRKAGGRGWPSSSRYVALPWCFSPCSSSFATKPSKGECSQGSEPGGGSARAGGPLCPPLHVSSSPEHC